MKERPIIFNAHSVQAILAGEKTQTRRVVKPQPAGNDFGKAFGYPPGSYTDNSGDLWPCPYGATGDRLWVREAWLPDPPIDGSWDDSLFNDGSGKLNYDAIPERFRSPDYCLYKTDWKGEEISWRSPMFMPRWASRINLLVTAVRVERLQDITEADAIAEGVQAPVTGSSEWGEPAEAVYEFMRLWDAMHAKRGYSWESNPYVWAVTFERVDTD